MKKFDAEYIVVGSGPAGGRIAYGLAKAGADILMLEAGRHYAPGRYPKSELEYSGRMFWGGGVELSEDGRMGFLRAKCVGGTSIVNQALLDRFDDDAFDDWKNRSGVDYFSSAQMQPLYEKVENSLSLQTIEEKYFGQNTRYFIKAFEKNGYGWAPLRRGQSDCALDKGTDCIACLGGCERHSKQSSLVTSIEPGMKIGLRLLSECQAKAIEVTPAGVKVTIFHGGVVKSLMAKKVILAAGSFGSTQILLASGYGKKLPTLGKGFACHPQLMAYGYFDQPVDAFKGAFQAVKSYDPKLRAMGLKFENVFAPPISTAMLLPGYGKQHQRWMQGYRYMASMEVAVRDEAVGEMKVTKGGKLVIRKKLTDQDQSRMKKGLSMIADMYAQSGAKEVVQCPQSFGLHLMGGCAIGTDGGKSVVNPNFQVHDQKNVFVVDSSLFPSAPGINPSLTIMALSEKALPEVMA